VVAGWFDRRLADPRRGDPPPPGLASPWRRSLAFGLVAAILYGGLFLPLTLPGLESEVDLATLRPARLFLLHGLLAIVLAAWAAVAYGGGGRAEGRPAPPVGAGPPAEAPLEPSAAAAPGASRGRFAAALAALRLSTRDPALEAGIGLLAGAGAWAAVLSAALALYGLLRAIGVDELLPSGVPPLVVYVARQPWAVRLGVSLSAGIVEEAFFRGFLQPRLGLTVTTLLFVLAHAGYGQPLQLVAVALLSIIYGLLTRWRGSIWAAATAHALFDAVQLLVIIPAALDLAAGGGLPGPAG
jgi:membrane protease YdiL (CAAX protease family)